MIGTSLLFSGGIAGLLGPGDFATPTAGYSLRPLSVSYSGYVVRVRKDIAGNPEKDFTATQLTNGDLEAFMNTFDESAHTLVVYEDFKRGIIPLTRPTQFYNFEDVSLISDCITGSSGVLEAHDTLGTLVDHNVEVYTDLEYSTFKTDASLLSACNTGGADELEAFTELSDLQTRNDGYVSKWYDQFGSNDADQSGATEQPKIWDASTGLVTQGGKPALDFAGDYLEVPSSTGSFNFLHDGTTSAVFSVVTFGKVADPNAFYSLIGNSGSTVNVGVNINYDDRVSASRNNANNLFITKGSAGNFVSLDRTDDKITPTEQYLMSYFLDANATASLRTQTGIDGGVLFGNNTDTNAPVASDATNNLQIGANGNDGSILTGYLQELIIYSTDQSANRTILETNINDYYDIF